MKQIEEIDTLPAELGEIELNVIGKTTIADLLRAGDDSGELTHCVGFGDGHATGCALTTIAHEAIKRGYVSG